MKKVTEEQVEEMKILRNEGKKFIEIAGILKLNPNTIKYHTSENFRERLRIYNRERYKKMSKEQKEFYLKKRKEYQRNYHRHRYNTDEKFRRKQLERVKNSIKMKGGVKNVY